MIGKIASYMPSLPHVSHGLKIQKLVLVTAVALTALSFIKPVEAGPVLGLLAGIGTAVAGGVLMGAGVILAPTGVGTGLMTAGAVVIAKAPVVAVVVGTGPTP